MPFQGPPTEAPLHLYPPKAHAVPSLNRYATTPDSPASRTGPPRSLSIAYSSPFSGNDTVHGYLENQPAPAFQHCGLRGAQQYSHATVNRDKKGKRRENRFLGGDLHDSPTEETQEFDWAKEDRTPVSAKGAEETSEANTSMKSMTFMRRIASAPQSSPDARRVRWKRVQSMFLPKRQPKPDSVNSAPSFVTATSVNIADELAVGGLSAILPRMWIERDEKGHRRIPVLLHRVRLHVSDSFDPMYMQKSVFRIECEYGNKVRWVVYRDLRDFLNLHIHYSVSNAYHYDLGHKPNIPEFPKNSIPYFRKLLSKENAQLGRRELASKQRAALEDYLIDLIRAVAFSPSANRIATFLELSALFIHLAGSGGIQYRAGYLKIQSIASGDGFGRKSGSRQGRKEERWCSLRESYIAFLDEAGETSVWDTFLFDSLFEVQRPKRYYRQGLNLLRPASQRTNTFNDSSPPPKESLLRSILDRLCGIFPCTKASPDKLDPFQIVLGQSTLPHRTPSQPLTPMLDPSTNVNPFIHDGDPEDGDRTESMKRETSARDVSKHTFYVINSQMKLKLRARSKHQLLQWITALKRAANHCPYTRKNRFDSFAPVRQNVSAQWLVDGRDYFWNLSRAMLLAKETIYIHDWWISPEMQLRRPGKDHYRLDHLLKQKACEGVKIYIILYQEVSNRTTPTDSNYAKRRLMSLHPNIMVQRSPSHLPTGTFYWAHHEKLCVIDQTIAFLGGLDLCFGRWDTPQHVLTDDEPESHIWHGKDYSNPRIRDFHELDKPDEDMYDRNKVPRMPWHDVGMQIIGQPSRDVARHFVQRWNWLLRIKNHSREMPYLLPPPEFNEVELLQKGLTGTCEVQICRSVGPWSMGTLGHVECSIQTAYIKAIQRSEHFVYIENQFFITSTIVNETRVENKVGDALVDRIIQAHSDGTPWKCCVLIPLLPGFTFPVDHSEASAVRIIMESQSRTISRGMYSIFSRLRKEGINPDDFIFFFSLRNWGKLKDGTLTTEQVYVHAKVCIVDDRLAIIGSANINERSLRGDRDSEMAAIVRDTDMMDCMMAGKPFKVGRFAHSLRVRLMREHLGIDVDGLEALSADQASGEPVDQRQIWDPDIEQRYGQHDIVTIARTAKLGSRTNTKALEDVESGGASKAARALCRLASNLENDPRTGSINLNAERRDANEKGEAMPGFMSCTAPTLEEKGVLGLDGHDNGILEGIHLDGNATPRAPNEEQGPVRDSETVEEGPEIAKRPSTSSEKSSARARSSLRHHLSKSPSNVWTLPTARPFVDPNIFDDPVTDSFWREVWVASAVRNTEIYRKVFHIVPDDHVSTWKQYKEFVSRHERMNKTYGDPSSDIERNSQCSQEEDRRSRDSPIATRKSASVERKGTKQSREFLEVSQGAPVSKPAKRSISVDKPEREEVEKLLDKLNGNLVVYPTKFLEGEDSANNFLYNSDRLLPLPIYI